MAITSSTQRLMGSGLIPLKNEDENNEDENNNKSTDKINATTNNESFRMVFTCNRCETRNMVRIKKKAWNSGTVIVTCQGCNVKHLLADNMSLVNSNDSPGDNKFTNVLEQLRDKQAVTFVPKYDSMNDDARRAALSEFDLTTDENGKIKLMPRPGDENVVQKDRISATGPMVDPSLIEETTNTQSQMAEIVDEKDGEDRAIKAVARMDSYKNGGSFDIDLPPETQAGDLLQLSIGGDNRKKEIIMLSVPEGIPSGSKVTIMGAIEFMVPKDNTEGDIITLKINDEGEEILLKVPPGIPGGSFMKVAYPVLLSER